jgi:hypothetical protein
MEIGHRRIHAISAVLMLSSIFCTQRSFAQPGDNDKDSVAIVEIGAAPGWSVAGSGPSISPTVAVEFTPIEHWLEIEIGTTPTFTHRSTEWTTDFLFKKPWTLSRKVEIMFGAGPEWIHARSYGVASNSIGGEVALDLMFWPDPKRRLGWYVEPAYDYDFGRGHEQSIGFSFGLLIKIP